MTIESRRRALLADRRRWGDSVSSVPHTGSPSKLDHTRENLSATASPITEPDPLDDNDSLGPLAGPVDPTYLQIPIPPSNTMISTKGWSLDSLINQSINFHHVRRISALSSSLSQIIDDHEESGLPLVVENCHKHSNWHKDQFTLDSFAAATSNEITVRNVHDWQDTVVPLSDFIAKSRSIATFSEEGEQKRFYGKDADCPKPWEDWLRNAGVVPQSLLSGGSQDLFRYRPPSSRVETLMCYLGVGDTFTPCHKDLCASSGQNLMCHTENNGSSFWFMTETASASEVAKFFHSLGRELDHEDYVITVDELSKAPFKVYILEQKLGDLVLVPPRSAHQVINFGGITVKTSWSRMTLKGLVAAYHHELPIYRRVCRPETYRVKSTIHYALLGLIKDLSQHANASNSCDNNEVKQLVSSIQELLLLYELILAEEFETHREEMPRRSAQNEANSIDDEHITCDFCGGDIFQSFFECRTCVEEDSAEGGYVVCPGCYSEGRSCKCQIMQRMQRRQFKLLLDTRAEAIQVVDMYERSHGRTFQPTNDYCDLNNHSYPRIFLAACILLDIRKKMKTVKVCTQSKHGSSSHNAPFWWALTCKMCHHAKCFPHILSEHRTHSVEALLLHNSDDSHGKYHHNHIVGRKTRFENSATDLISSRFGYQQLVYYATHFTYCKPVKPQFMNLGWYDKDAHSSYISDDQESPSQTEIESVLIPDTAVSESGPIDVQPRTSSMPNFRVKSTKKNKAYVLVPKAPYPLPPHCLPDQGSGSQQRTQAISPPSAPLITQQGPQQMVPEPGQSLPPLLEKRKVPKALTASKPSTLTPLNIGISIPTTVRKPGSFIIHLRGFVPRNRIPAEAASPTERPVEPAKSPTTRISKPPHVANPVTAQVITKKSIADLKFKKKSRFSKPNSQPSSSNNAKVAASTGTQEGGIIPSLPESQPTPPILHSGTAILSPDTFADALVQRLGQKLGGFLLSHKPMNPDMSSNSNGGPQIPYNHSQYDNGHPQQYNGPPRHYNGPPHHYNEPHHYNGPQRYNEPHHYNGPPQRYNGPPPQRYNGPPQHYNDPPQHYNGPPQRYDDQPPHFYNGYPHHIQHPHIHPQRHNNYHPASYPISNQPRFDQDNRKPPHHNQAPMQFVGRTGYVHHQPPSEYTAHQNGRNKMPAQSAKFKPPYKKRKYGFHDSPSQPRPPNKHRLHNARLPQGPRGYKHYESTPKSSTYGQVEYHDGMERSTSREHERLSWGTSGDETPSTYFQSHPAHERGGYHPRYSFNAEAIAPSYRNHTGFNPSFEPKSEGSDLQRRIYNDDVTMDATDVDANDIIQSETPSSPMADPTFPTPQDGIYPDDLVLTEDDAHHEAGIPMDDLTHSIVEDQGNDQIWEDSYEIPEERDGAIEALRPESAPQLAPAARGSLDSVFNVTDDCMADVTTNPWTTTS